MPPRNPLIPHEEPSEQVAGEGSAFQVGDLARRVGKTVRALHLYEELGLLRPLRRSKGRYRLYGEDALVRIRWISKLQDLGLSLHEIRGMTQEIENVQLAPKIAERMREIYAQKLEETREQLLKLKELESELEHALGYLGECSSLCDGEPALSQCRSCGLHRSASSADLVRGFQVVQAPSSTTQLTTSKEDSTIRRTNRSPAKTLLALAPPSEHR